MDTLDPTTTQAPDLAEAYRYLFQTLRAATPTVDDSPQAANQRDQAIIALVAGLCPANMAEAMLVAQYAAANAHALRCLAQTSQDATPGKDADHLAARANTMMRRAEGALGTLVRLQTIWGKRDADAASASHAAWIEHAVATWMRGEDESQNPRHDPDNRNHETKAPQPAPPPNPPQQAGSDRPASTPTDPSHEMTHRPDDQFHETIVTRPTPPADHAAKTGTPPTDPPSDEVTSDNPSHAKTHCPDDRFHETNMTTPNPPQAGAAAARDLIRHSVSSATREAVPSTSESGTAAINRATAHHRFPPPFPKLGSTTTDRSAPARPESSADPATITLG